MPLQFYDFVADHVQQFWFIRYDSQFYRLLQLIQHFLQENSHDALVRDAVGALESVAYLDCEIVAAFKHFLHHVLKLLKVSLAFLGLVGWEYAQLQFFVGAVLTGLDVKQPF